MSAPPKPAKRGPKPRRPIKLSTSPLKRTSLHARVRRSKAGQEKHRKDRAWSEAIKAKGPCVALGRWMLLEWATDATETLFKHIRCAGPIDPGHVLSRTFPATRNDVANGVPICRAAHDWFTMRPMAWEWFCRPLLGDQEYDRLYALPHGNISRSSLPIH